MSSTQEELKEIVLKAQQDFEKRIKQLPLTKKQLILLSYSNWNVEVTDTLMKFPKSKTKKKKKTTKKKRIVF